MGANLTWKKTDGDPVKFALTGEITEFAELLRLQQELGARNELDLGGITQVNSTGVREWMKFIQAVATAEQHLVLRRCSVAFVNQLNMIRRFAGSAKIESILTPYACPSCEATTERHLNLAPDIDINTEAETPMACPTCGDAMIFDDVPGVFFAFLNAPK